MKKLARAALITGIVILFNGCLSALHPLFTEKDIVFDPRLVGIWRVGDKDTAIFQKGSTETFRELPEELQHLAGKAYLLTIKDAEEELKYYAFLSRIGKELYLDYYPAETLRQHQYDGFYKQHLTRLHSFYKVQFNNSESFKISQFDEKYLRDLINNKQIRIRHEVRFDGSYVITAPTEELQQYVLKYGSTPEAYIKEDIDTYIRITNH